MRGDVTRSLWRGISAGRDQQGLSVHRDDLLARGHSDSSQAPWNCSTPYETRSVRWLSSPRRRAGPPIITSCSQAFAERLRGHPHAATMSRAAKPHPDLYLARGGAARRRAKNLHRGRGFRSGRHGSACRRRDDAHGAGMILQPTDREFAPRNAPRGRYRTFMPCSVLLRSRYDLSARSRARLSTRMHAARRSPYFTTAAVWPNNSLRSSSVRFTGWPKFGLTSLALA